MSGFVKVCCSVVIIIAGTGPSEASPAVCVLEGCWVTLHLDFVAGVALLCGIKGVLDMVACVKHQQAQLHDNLGTDGTREHQQAGC